MLRMRSRIKSDCTVIDATNFFSFRAFSRLFVSCELLSAHYANLKYLTLPSSGRIVRLQLQSVLDGEALTSFQREGFNVGEAGAFGTACGGRT